MAEIVPLTPHLPAPSGLGREVAAYAQPGRVCASRLADDAHDFWLCGRVLRDTVDEALRARAWRAGAPVPGPRECLQILRAILPLHADPAALCAGRPEPPLAARIRALTAGWHAAELHARRQTAGTAGRALSPLHPEEPSAPAESVSKDDPALEMEP
jgi:hypothetical protein